MSEKKVNRPRAKYRKIVDPKVEAAFNVFPPAVRKKLIQLRMLIFDTANKTEGVGELEETLKWGQPSYLTKKSKSGSTIRIGREKRPKEITQFISNAKHLWWIRLRSFTKTNSDMKVIEQFSLILAMKFRLMS